MKKARTARLPIRGAPPRGANPPPTPPPRPRARNGFTLAELLVTVAIMSALVAVAVPVFSKQMEQSRQNADIAVLRQAYAVAKVAEMTQMVNGESLKDNNDEWYYGPSSISNDTELKFVVFWYNPKTGELESAKGDNSNPVAQPPAYGKARSDTVLVSADGVTTRSTTDDDVVVPDQEIMRYVSAGADPNNDSINTLGCSTIPTDDFPDSIGTTKKGCMVLFAGKLESNQLIGNYKLGSVTFMFYNTIADACNDSGAFYSISDVIGEMS